MHVDTSYGPLERQCIVDSAEQWRSQTRGLADVELEFDYDTHKPLEVARRRLSNRIVRWSSQSPVVVEIEKELTEDQEDPYILLGQVNGKGIRDPWHNPIEMRLVADRLQDPHTCRLTAIHEFGHVFGIPHLPNKTDIMYPSVSYSRSACLKAEDLLAFCFYNDCANVDMKPCPDDPPGTFATVRTVSFGVSEDEPKASYDGSLSLRLAP